jgi:hypothetical protein
MVAGTHVRNWPLKAMNEILSAVVCWTSSAQLQGTSHVLGTSSHVLDGTTLVSAAKCVGAAGGCLYTNYYHTPDMLVVVTNRGNTKGVPLLLEGHARRWCARPPRPLQLQGTHANYIARNTCWLLPGN